MVKWCHTGFYLDAGEVAGEREGGVARREQPVQLLAGAVAGRLLQASHFVCPAKFKYTYLESKVHLRARDTNID